MCLGRLALLYLLFHFIHFSWFSKDCWTLKAECSQTRACALRSQTWKNWCRKSSFRKQNGVVYGSGVNFNTGYIIIDLFNFGAKSTRLKVIFTRCSKLLQLTLICMKCNLISCSNNDWKTQSIKLHTRHTMRHCGWELCSLLTFICFRRPDEPGPSLQSAESARWLWKETPTRGTLQKARRTIWKTIALHTMTQLGRLQLEFGWIYFTVLENIPQDFKSQ
jgi:hypothetical protein